jgi:hypothetical protein
MLYNVRDEIKCNQAHFEKRTRLCIVPVTKLICKLHFVAVSDPEANFKVSMSISSPSGRVC